MKDAVLSRSIVRCAVIFFVGLSTQAVLFAQTPISYGEDVPGAISAAGEVDEYTFAGSSGEVITLQVADRSNSSPDPCFEFFDPSGSPIGSKTCNSSIARIDTTLTTSGQYSIRVSEDPSGGNHTISYMMSLERVGPTPSPNAISIAFGDDIAGTISPSGEVDLFSFAGSSGEIIILQVADRSNSSPDPCFEFFDPSGSPIGSKTCNSSIARIDTTLTTSGQYSIRVSEDPSGGNHTINYSISLVCTSGCSGVVRNLTVASSDPDSGVSITVSPADNNGDSDGTTPQFTREYDDDTSVTLTAPDTADGNPFKEWVQNGQSFSADTTINVTMDADYTMTAVYAPPPEIDGTVSQSRQWGIDHGHSVGQKR